MRDGVPMSVRPPDLINLSLGQAWQAARLEQETLARWYAWLSLALFVFVMGLLMYIVAFLPHAPAGGNLFIARAALARDMEALPPAT